ncbi:hypothetical protein AUI06_08060 [archaeon 13_2_20CM_2_52_21]|nr:MAG: hypothetical protein AUI06_08060 [archaeon 13_2_20CM_2_52_21]OLD44012.1 MAG: hypothetical protein AUI51_04235 [archaeon 13_1_40CM_2_52_4]
MTRPIGTVKKEVRTLGLDTCNPGSIVGVIVRGGLYLDGVISLSSGPNNASRRCANRIIQSAYFPELRALMIHDPNDELDSTVVERVTKLPTVAISEDKPNRGRGYHGLQGDIGRLWVKTRLESTTLKKILSVSWTIDKLPEPLRVAHLLSKLKARNGVFMR